MAVAKPGTSPYLSVLVPAKDCAESLRTKIEILHHYLMQNLPVQFEIVVIPNGPDDFALEQTVKCGQMLAASFPNVKCVNYQGLRGKAAALRAGFDESVGKHIAFIDADLPFNLDFFKQAFLEVEGGVDLVSANRRIAQSVFVVPVPLLPLVNKRHWAGLAFNRFIRLLFPIVTLDTQAGLKYMSRTFARQVFRHQLCTGFLLDVELILVAVLTKVKHVELPVTLYLYTEKSTVRLARELWYALKDVALIWLRYHAGEYSDSFDEGDHAWAEKNFLTSDDWGISPGVNDGILELAKRGVVRRVSVLANGEYLEYKLDELKALKNVSLGLHFNLTYGQPLAAEIDIAQTLQLYSKANGRWYYKRPLQLFWATFLPLFNGRRLRWQIAHAFQTQLAKLNSLKLKIDYFDGHHHVHLLPTVLNVIAPLARQKQLEQSRLILDSKVLISRKFPLVLLSLWAKRSFKKNDISYLKCRYPKYFHFVFPSRFRRSVKDLRNYEIIAHPAKYPDLQLIDSPDLYNGERVREHWTLLNVSSPKNSSNKDTIC